jgi:hypothetical protein
MGFSYQAARVSSFSELTPALAALAAPASTQALQPLIWLARRVRQLQRLTRYAACVRGLDQVLDARRDIGLGCRVLDACCHVATTSGRGGR